MDKEFLAKLVQGLYDSANRGAVAGTLGMPVDTAALALGLIGYDHKRPVGGSEWIGQKMQDYGMVSPNRNPMAENIALMASAPMRPGGYR